MRLYVSEKTRSSERAEKGIDAEAFDWRSSGEGMKNYPEYINWFGNLKEKIRIAQIKAGVAVNSILIELYWEIGKEIVNKQQNSAWGNSFIETLARDLKLEFPEIKGFSRRNLYAIRQWYKFYSANYPIVPQPVAQIPWGHNRLIASKVKNIEEAIFYAKSSMENGWSRNTLESQIESEYYKRKGKAITNFSKTLPSAQSDLAKETVKDPYNFDFLGLEDDAQEREIDKEEGMNHDTYGSTRKEEKNLNFFFRVLS